MEQLNRVQRELGSARLRGPDASGRPSEPELDNASEGRAYLFTLLDTTGKAGGFLSPDSRGKTLASSEFLGNADMPVIGGDR